MLQSKLINKFFTENQDHDNFWDFVHENRLYDAQWWDGDDNGPELVTRGFELAKSAGSEPVYKYERGESILYFIGSEQKIINKLTDAWTDYLDSNPIPTEKEKQLMQIKAMREEAELLFEKARDRLEHFKNEEDKLNQ